MKYGLRPVGDRSALSTGNSVRNPPAASPFFAFWVLSSPARALPGNTAIRGGRRSYIRGSDACEPSACPEGPIGLRSPVGERADGTPARAAERVYPANLKGR